MSDNIKKISDELAGSVSGGGANGPTWVENGITWYRIVRGDTLSEIAMRFGTSVYQLQALNSGLIKNPDVIKEGWVIRIY